MDRENGDIAAKLREAAALLESQQAGVFRVAAYRRAAATLEGLGRPVRGIFDDQGVSGLEALPGIGRGIAGTIAQLLVTGRWPQLERLRGTGDPARVLRAVPGIGAELATRIHEELHIDTLEELEAAAHDGRLERLPGVGRRRVAAWRASLDQMLGRFRRRRPETPEEVAAEPPVGLLLEIDRDYRACAEADRLPTIAPRRFNPEGRSWLPVMHEQRGDWHFTALYSNTALAHRLGRTHDWVVIYFYDHDHVERQRTVVTEMLGALRNRRVVRGREAECAAFYQGAAQAA